MSFQQIGDLVADVVAGVERDQKLRLIAGLSAAELQGWLDQMRRPGSRLYFEGERAALADRARRLGVSI